MCIYYMCINIQWLYVLYISMYSITCMCKDISYRYILYGYMCIYNMYLYTHTWMGLYYDNGYCDCCLDLLMCIYKYIVYIYMHRFVFRYGIHVKHIKEWIIRRKLPTISHNGNINGFMTQC